MSIQPEAPKRLPLNEIAAAEVRGYVMESPARLRQAAAAAWVA